MLGFYDYTVVLTYISLGISVFGITHAMDGDLRIAVFCLALSGLCDMFDGKIARTKKNRTEEEKQFGIQIDSLCVVVCFGALPIAISYRTGMDDPLGLGILILYGITSVIRLGYFNVMEAKRQEESDEVRDYYQGLPITSMAIVLPFLYLFRKFCGMYYLETLHMAVALVGILFVTNIKVKKPQNPVIVVLIVVIALIFAKMFRLI